MCTARRLLSNAARRAVVCEGSEALDGSENSLRNVLIRRNKSFVKLIFFLLLY